MKGFFVLTYITALMFNISTAKAITAPVDSDKYIRLKLSGSDFTMQDEAIILFKKNATPQYKPGEDAPYFQGTGKVRLFSYSSDRVALVFNLQPLPVKCSAIYLNVFTRFDGMYQLKMPEIKRIPPLFDIWLIDNLLKDSIDMRHNPTYSFNVSKADTNTFGGGRFKLVIRRNTALAYRLLSFNADKVTESKGVQIHWNTENEENYTAYTIERSTDNGKTFIVIDSLRSNGTGHYNLKDNSPTDGLNSYRLKQTSFDDAVSYSATIPVNYKMQENPPIKNLTNTPATNIYPNPVINFLNVAINSKTPAGSYSISITNMWGSTIKEGTTTSAKWQAEVSDLKPGAYLVKVTNNTDKSVVGYNKFFKN